MSANKKSFILANEKVFVSVSAIPCRLLLTFHIVFIMIVIITNRGIVVNKLK